MITELAPVMTGIALAGVVGARIAAELAAMRVTEQIDALEVIGRGPVTYLAVPRILAGLVAGPVLVAFALAAGMACGWFVALMVTPVGGASLETVRRYVEQQRGSAPRDA